VSQSKYRADIDGLRTIAVALVFINHAFPKGWLPSGFVGVDVFFVISGFVVTASILAGGYGDGWSGILEFWRRRILRIIPALVVFVVVTSVLFAAFFAVTTRIQFAGTLNTGLTSLAGLSNLYLIRIAHDYFQADLSTNLFTHTWSLGVEEQFYLIFAPLAFALAAPRMQGVLSRFSVTLGVLALLSLGLFLWQAGTAPVATYYGLHTRLWELGVGALIAVWLARGLQAPGPETAGLLTAVGALLIGVGATWSTQGEDFRTPILLAVSGAALLIIFGSTPTPVSRVLALRPMVFLGLISYGIYLWHWPVLVFLRWNIGLTPVTFLGSVVLVIALAWLSYRFVETPIRHVRAPLGSRVFPVAALAIGLIAAGSLFLAREQGRFYAGTPFDGNDWLPPLHVAYAPEGRLSGRDCLLTRGASVPTTVPERCQSGTGARVLVVGDSHAYSQFGMLGALARRGQAVQTLAHDGCSWYRPAAELTPSCAAYLDQVPAYIRQLSAGDTVLIVPFLPHGDFDPTTLQARLSAATAAAEPAGVRVLVELPHLRMRTSALYCVPEWFRTKYDGCTRPRADLEAARAPAVAVLRGQPDIHLWDLLPELCPDDTCQAVTPQGPILRDYNHLSASASTALADSLLAQLAALP
jgi:peptidoglycan/LPS O-acetylase OafA/YrhL